MKDIDVINRFNRVDIEQTQDFIKMYNKKYIKNILSIKGLLYADIPGDKHSTYILIHNDKKYNTTIKVIPPIPKKELPAIKK